MPHNGQPIVLMNDDTPAGGYPRIACIIRLDMYHLAQIPSVSRFILSSVHWKVALKARARSERSNN
ncbi:hypothetical protein ACLBR5_23730 [Escherichia coli]